LVKKEIVSGLRNAIERGESLEKAMQSFANAGYNPQEIQQAAAEAKQDLVVAAQPQATTEQQPTKEQTLPIQAKPGKKKLKITILVIILLLLLGFLGIMFFL